MSRKLILASAVSLALLPGAAAALGLGAIRSQSALNEPFFAEIDLLDVQPDEIDSVKVLLAPPGDFDKAGAPRPHFLTRLRFQPQVSPQGRPVIAVTTPDPVREPFLDFLVEVNWPKGRMVKGFTVLLDPPVTVRSSPPPVERPRVSSVRPTRSDVPTEARVPPADAPIAAIPPGAEDGPYPVRYGPVASGMGLWRAARELAPPGATVSQTAMALYRSNQDAFIRQDINKLKVGKVLEIPSATELFALSPADAERQFRAALRGEAVAAAPLAPAADRLKIATAPAPAPEEAAPAAAVPASPSTGPSPDLGALQQELLLVREEGESTRQETEELHERIRELEARLADIQRLLKLRNEQLAQIQGMQLEPPVVSPAEASDVPPAVVPEGEPAEEAVAQAVSEPAQPTLDSIDATDAAAEDGEPVAAEEPPIVAGETGAAGQPVSEAEVAESESEDAAPVEPVAPAPEIAETGLQPQTGEALARVQPVGGEAAGPEAGKPSWMAVAESPAGMAGALAVLSALLAMAVVQRRRRLQESFKGDALMPDLALPAAVAEPMAVSSAGQGQRGQPAPVSQMSTQVSVMGDLDNETEEADIVSEADVYIAYGRYREAETLLEQELERTPGRLDLKFKLAEAYFGARNLLSLKRLSAEMREDGSDRVNKDQWERLETMLRELEGGTDTRGRRGESSTSGRARLELVGEADKKVLADPPIRSGSDGRQGRAGPLSLELDVEDIEVVAAAPPAPNATGGDAATKDLELELEELERFSAMRFEEAGGSATKEPAARPAKDSLDILSMGGDSLASEVLSSKWQTESLWDEVATKLDLARAYMEMEDPDAARVILAEVAREGNPDQQAEAKEMLARLD